MAEVGESDALAQDCNATINDELKKAKKKILFWLIVGMIATLSVKLAHWFLEVPENVNSWDETIGGVCGVMIVWWLVVYVPFVSAVAVVLEFRTRLITLSERLDSLKNAQNNCEKPL